MIGRDMILTNMESRRHKREEQEQHRAKKSRQHILKMEAKAELSSSSSSSSSPMRPQDEGASTSTSDMPPTKRKRASKKILNPQLAAAMDRTSTTDREAVHLLNAAAESFGQNPDEYAINRESVRRDRRKFRAEFASKIKHSFHPSVPLTVHWDGKILPAADGGPAIDRLSVLVTGDGVEKFLASPSIPNGTGQAAADAIFTTLEDWGLEKQVVALSFDTTPSNTGLTSGACSLVEQKLGHDVLHLACRHHTYELICEKAFSTCFGAASGPEIQIFKKFREKWKDVDKMAPKAMELENMSQHLSDKRETLLLELQSLLDGLHPRKDYREIIELSIVVLGGEPRRGIHIARPGAIHRARWMAKVIYALKMYLFRDQEVLNLRKKDISTIKRFVEFSIAIYVVPWSKARCAASAPAQDLDLLKSLLAYPDREISEATSTSFGRHMWYLSERLIALAFFDDGVSCATKRDMVKASQDQIGLKEPRRRVTVDTREANLEGKTVADFVTTGSLKFFELMNIDTQFLSTDPASWEENPAYLNAQKRIKALQVVNDFAERGVAMVQRYHSAHTKDETQKQYLLQVVESHHKSYPSASRQT